MIDHVRRAELDVLRLAVQWRILAAEPTDPLDDPVSARWAAEAATNLAAAVDRYDAARDAALQDAGSQGEHGGRDKDGREDQDQADARS